MGGNPTGYLETPNRRVFVLEQHSLSESEMKSISGDINAFGNLIRIYDDDLRSVAWTVVKTKENVDDVMQSAYENAFTSLSSFKKNSSLKTWLHSVVYLTALNFVRHQSYRNHESLESLHDYSDTTSIADQVLSKVDVENIFSELETDERVLLIMIYAMEFTFDEAAEVLEMNRNSLASKVKRIREKLAEGNQNG